MKRIIFFMAFSVCVFAQKIVFYHIPKTGGQSLIKMLRSKYPDNKICKSLFYYQIENMDISALNQYDLFTGHFFYSGNLKELNAFTFTYLREPVSRIVSEQNFFLEKYSQHLGDLRRLAKYHAFDRGNPVDMISNNQTMWLSSFDRNDPSISIQEHFESAIQNLSKMDFVGIFENFDESTDMLYALLGWNPEKHIVKTNKSCKRYRLSEKKRQQVLERNQYDILLYEYARELFEKKREEMFKKSLVSSESKSI